MTDDPKPNGQHSNGSSASSAAAPAGPKIIEIGGGKGGAFHMQQLIDTERPARMVGLFTMRLMKPHELQRLVEVCLQAMKEEDSNAELSIGPMGEANAHHQVWRVTMRESAEAQPHDCLVQLFAIDDPASTHRALIDHLFNMEEQLGQEAVAATQGAQSYLTIASGRLDDGARVHPFQNLVALFSSALGACIIDPAAAVVTEDAGEWAEALEMSLQLEKDMHLLRK